MITPVIVVALICSSSHTYVVGALPPFRLENIQCHEGGANDVGWYDRECCWDQYNKYNEFNGTFCQTCTLRQDGSILDCGNVICPSGDCTWSEGLQPPTPPTGVKAPLGANILPTPSVSPGENIPDDGRIVGQPPLFGRNVGNAPLGLFGQEPTTGTTMVAPPPKLILTPEPTPDLPITPDQPVPMFGLRQQPTPTPTPPPLFGQVAPQGQLQPPATTLGGGEGKEGGQDTQSRSTSTVSPTGYCVPFNKITCVPCDPGLPGADCIPQSEWPPASTTGEDIPQAQLPTEEEEEEEEQPPGALPRPPVGGMPPEAQIAPEDDEGTQPQIQDDGAAEE